MSNPVLVHDEGGRGAKGSEPPAKQHQVEEKNKSATETVAPTEASAVIITATAIDAPVPTEAPGGTEPLTTPEPIGTTQPILTKAFDAIASLSDTEAPAKEVLSGSTIASEYTLAADTSTVTGESQSIEDAINESSLAINASATTEAHKTDQPTTVEKPEAAEAPLPIDIPPMTETLAASGAPLASREAIDDDAESLMASIDAMLEVGSIAAAVGVSIPAAGTTAAQEVGAVRAAAQVETPSPPRPAFEYCVPDEYPPAAHSAHAYHYTHEGELTLEAALAGAGQGASQGEGQGGSPPPPLNEPPAIDASTMLRELELGFNLRRFEDGGGLLQSDPPSVEYSENGATLQSELFELGQGGFAQGPSTSGELPPASTSAPPAPVAELAAEALMPEDAPEWSHIRPAVPEIHVPLTGSVACIEAAPAPAGPPPAAAIDEPGPSRSRRHMHTVHLYPGGGEGEPHTCYLKTLPQLAFVGAFEEERAPPASHSAMLQELLGAAGEEEGEVPPSSSPSPSPSPSPGPQRALSEYREEPDKENKPDTIAEALRSAVISFADLDAEDALAQATERDREEILPEDREEILPEDEPAAAAIEGMATPLAESAPDAPADLVTVAPVISTTSAETAVATSADIPGETGTVAPGKPADESSISATGDDTLISATVTVAEIAPGASGDAGPSAQADAAAPVAPPPRKRSGKKLKRKRAATAQPANAATAQTDAAATAQPAAAPKPKRPKKQPRAALKPTTAMVLRSRKQHI